MTGKNRFIYGNIELPNIGSTSSNIPVLTLGKGDPTISLMFSLHGDENSSLFLADRLIEHLSKNPFQGTINILPSCNPLAQIQNSRVNPFDLSDLNRVGKGDKYGQLTEVIAHRLYKFLMKSDLVLDFHHFEMRSPVISILPECDNQAVKNQTCRYIEIFDPDLVWFIPNSQSNYNNIFSKFLLDEGVPNFIIECSNYVNLSNIEFDSICSRIFKLFDAVGSNKDNELLITGTVPTFIRHEQRSQETGLWYPNPKIEMMQPIDSNTILGEIVAIPKFERIQVKSRLDGTLLQYREREFVVLGQSLVGVGEKTLV